MSNTDAQNTVAPIIAGLTAIDINAATPTPVDSTTVVSAACRLKELPPHSIGRYTGFLALERASMDIVKVISRLSTFPALYDVELDSHERV